MKISRRKFLEIGSVTTISTPFLLSSCSPVSECTNLSDDLYESFKNPPGSARPFVRWWWNGDKLTREEFGGGWIKMNYGGGLDSEKVIDKINEVIDYLNKPEQKKREYESE